ncbi:MAG: general secretion pathway protein K [Candidatus Azotimanducaceae bacterium]|jgi:general secretion pathway protein K
MHLGRKFREQRGVALISILLVVVIATVLGVKMTTEQYFSIIRASNYFEQGKIRQYALGGEELARQMLFKDFIDQPQKDLLTEEWASKELKFEFEEGEIEMLIEDLQGRFNLNSLISTGAQTAGAGGLNNPTVGRNSQQIGAQQSTGGVNQNQQGIGAQGGALASAQLAMTRFRTLLNQQGLDPVFADRVKDWIDNNQDTTQLGAEDFDYLGLERPYRTSDSPMVDISELRLVLDIDSATFAVLEPLVATLPTDVNLINVNTASSSVIQAIAGSGLSFDAAEALTVQRDEGEGFDSVQNFLQDNSLAGQGVSPDGLSVQSSFFKVSIRARIGDRFGYLASVIQRNPIDGSMRVIFRDASKKIYPVIAPIEF